jgi:hypothetical protein
MEPQVSASFIPKKPLVDGGGPRRSAMGLVVLASLLIFVASLLAAGATFAYTQFLKSSIVSKKDSLAKAQSAYDPAIIEDLMRLDSRIAESKRVLTSHVAPSAVFTFLSLQTLEKVRFTNFDLELESDGGPTISLDGEADSFSTIALQSDQFGASKVLRDVVFSNLAIDEDGSVNFTVNAKVEDELLLYSKSLITAPPQEQQEQTDVPEVIQSSQVQTPPPAPTSPVDGGAGVAPETAI